MNQQQEELSRRQFLELAIGTAGGLIGLGMVVPGIGAVVSPAIMNQEVPWASVGSVASFELDEPQLTSFARPQGKGQEPVHRAIYVVRKQGDNFVVFDVACTHLGCPVQWNKGAHQFFSPCHGGAFDAEGQVVAGPPPRPLDRYQTRVVDDTLQVGKQIRLKSSDIRS